MTEQEHDASRARRSGRLRTAWRRQSQSPSPSDDEQPESPAQEDEAHERRSKTLNSNDRIRAEAPDDLETRRRADQLEREVKRKPRGQSRSPNPPGAS